MKHRACLLIAGLVLTGSLICCRRENPYEKPLTPVTVRPVETYAGEAAVRYSGSVEPYAKVDLAFRVGGYVQEILPHPGADGHLRPLQEGDWATKGTVLARLREMDYAAKVGQAKSQLAQAIAGVDQATAQLKEAEKVRDQAKVDLDRAANLFQNRSLTKSDYDTATVRFATAQARVETAQATIEAARARVEGARAQLEEVQLTLGDCALKAPSDAMVLRRLIEVGALVGPGSPAFVLADTKSVKVVFGVPDVVLPSLRLGMPLSMTTEAITGADFSGRITRISPAADPKSRVFDVEITIPNQQNRLKVGMIATIQVPGSRPTSPLAVVPLTAIVRSKEHSDSYAVFVVEGRGDKVLARAREVSLGETLGNLIAVRSGVQPGERVIVSGATLVQEGQPVQIVP